MTAFFLRRKDDRSQTQASTAKELPNQCGHALAIFSSGFVLFSASTERKCLGGELELLSSPYGSSDEKIRWSSLSWFDGRRGLLIAYSFLPVCGSKPQDYGSNH